MSDKKVTKLLVKEFVIPEDNSVKLPQPGFKYSYFFDPETGKYYRPKSTFEVTGDDLLTLFEEVEN